MLIKAVLWCPQTLWLYPLQTATCWLAWPLRSPSLFFLSLSLLLSRFYQSQIQSCKPLRPLLCTLTNVINLKRIHPEWFPLHFPFVCSASLSVFICGFSFSCFSSRHSVYMSALIRLLFRSRPLNILLCVVMFNIIDQLRSLKPTVSWNDLRMLLYKME